MNRLISWDIESTNLLDETSIDYSSFPYKIKESYQTHCIVAQDIKTEEIFTFVQNDCKDFIDFVMEECIILIGHNIIDFDNNSNKLDLGWKYEVQPNAHKRLKMSDPYEKLPDRINGKPIKFIDTMILSKLLNADRFGRKHSLEEWGKRLKYYKGDFGKQEAAWDKYTPEMLEYCIQDVKLTTKVYQALVKEAGEYDWTESYTLEVATRDLVSSKSQHLGFKLDQKLGYWCVDDLNKKMKDIELKVEPLLPQRMLPKSQQLTPPTNPFKKAFDYKNPFTIKGGLKKPVIDYLIKIGYTDPDNQLKYIKSMIKLTDIAGHIIHKNNVEVLLKKHKSLLSSSAISYCNKIGIKDEDKMFDEIIQLQKKQKSPKKLSEKMRLKHEADVKSYLVNQGWKPTTWNDRDLTLDAKKRKRSKKDVIKAIEKYVEDTITGPYCKFRCKFLKKRKENLKEFLLKKPINRPIKVKSTPKYTKNQDKDLCDGLVRMGEEFSYVEDIVSWLTYKHRRNTLLSPNGTGWLTDNRLKVDSHISTPADTLGAISGRFTHRKIVNCPRVTSLYGEYMRGILGVDEWAYQLGFDADGLEARMEAAFVHKYPGGPEYVKKLIGKKPNDLHTLNAKKFEISRDESKTLKYSLAYGAQAPKVSEQQGWPLKRAKTVVEQYWKEAKPVKLLIDNLEKHWESNNKEFIITLDKRKIPVRAKHVLLNLLWQNAGLVCMKRSHVLLDRWLKEENLLGDPFKHDLSIEPKSTFIICYHDELQQSIHKSLVRLKYFKTKEEAEDYKNKVEENDKFILSDVGKGFEEGHKDEYFVGWSRVGELTVKSLLVAGEYYDLPIQLTSGYQLGFNWSQCH